MQSNIITAAEAVPVHHLQPFYPNVQTISLVLESKIRQGYFLLPYHFLMQANYLSLKMKKVKMGQARVSTAEQNEDRQIIAMNELQIHKDNIFMDKVSGKDFERSAYKALIKKLTAGDLLYIKSINHLGCNYDEIQNQWRLLTKERGIDIVVIYMPLLDTRNGKDLLGTLITDLVLNLLSYVAHNERDAIRKRQVEGIAATKAKGVHLCRPIKKPPANFTEVAKLWERGKINFEEALMQTGFKQATFYNRLRELRSRKKK